MTGTPKVSAATVAAQARLAGVEPGGCAGPTCYGKPSFNVPRLSVEGRIGWECQVCGGTTLVTVARVMAQLGTGGRS